ncbi:MAG: DUF2062 domain-containing protein [Phocaeicola sp.]
MNKTKEIFSTHKVLVVIPTYNNAATIAQVVNDVNQWAAHVLVVNDGSTDETETILHGLGVNRIGYSKNRGKGYAIRQSFRYAMEQGYQYVLTIDSDGQHYASDLATFATYLEEYPERLVVGARNLQADNMPSKNTFANKFSNFWFWVETGQKMEDTQSGFRLYPLKRMGKISFLSNRYEFEVEVIVRSAWKGVEVCNVPIQVYYPPQEERVSHFKPLKDFTRISILNTFLVLIALLVYYPWRCLQWFTKENIRNFIKSNITETTDSNHQVAASVGLGIFFGILPIWGYQMLTAACTAHFLKLNKVLTLVSSNISLPPLLPFILYGSFCLGGWILGREVNLAFSSITWETASNDILQYVYGAVTLAVALGIISYLVVRLLLIIFRKKQNG